MLNAKQRQHLKALSHSMKPVVSAGKKGLSDALIKEVEAALLAHELIKIKFQESAATEMHSITQSICEQTGAEEIETRGYIATLYRAHPQKPRIQFNK